MYGTFTTATAVGRRDYQEDRFVTATMDQGTLLAVFDGHGGDKCVDLLADTFVSTFMRQLSIEQDKAQLSEREVDFKSILLQTFAERAAATNHFDDGSTCSAVFIPKDQDSAYVAVLGDSPVIARLTSGTLWVGPEHNGRSNPAELKAAQERGGIWTGAYICVSYHGHGLQMSRAFGDSDCFFLNREPEVFKIPLGRWLLVATDGIMDPGHKDGTQSSEVLAAMVDGGANAQDLVNIAVSVPTGDNVTAILWRFSNE